MALEELSQGGLESVSSEQIAELQTVVSDIGAPQSITDQVLELTQHHGPEMLTAVLGYIGIHLINEGSSKYGDLQHATSEEEEREIIKDASGKIFGGAGALSAIAFAAGNPLFALPEVAALLTSLRPYLASRSRTVERILEKTRADLLLISSSIAIGSYTIAHYADNAANMLPPIGLTMLSSAFAMGGSKAREWLYRVLTVGGGSTMIAGSTFAAVEAAQQSNHVGFIMSSVFLVLNGLFTRSEVKATMNLFKVRQETIEKVEELLDEQQA